MRRAADAVVAAPRGAVARCGTRYDGAAVGASRTIAWGTGVPGTARGLALGARDIVAATRGAYEPIAGGAVRSAAVRRVGIASRLRISAADGAGRGDLKTLAGVGVKGASGLSVAGRFGHVAGAAVHGRVLTQV